MKSYLVLTFATVAFAAKSFPPILPDLADIIRDSRSLFERMPEQIKGQMQSSEMSERERKQTPLSGNSEVDEAVSEKSEKEALKMKEICKEILAGFSHMCRCHRYEPKIYTIRSRRKSSEQNMTKQRSRFFENITKIDPKHKVKRHSLDDPMEMSTSNWPPPLFRRPLKRFSRQDSSSGQGQAGEDESGAEKVGGSGPEIALECGCAGDQLLQLPGVASLPPAVKSLLVADCRGGTVVLEPSNATSSALVLVSFVNVHSLLLKGGALDLQMLEDASLATLQIVFKNIASMRVERGGIRLSGQHRAISLEVKNVIIESLPSFSITLVNMVSMLWDGVLIVGEVFTAAVNIEMSKGHFEMNEVDARAGMKTGWISAGLSKLTLTGNRLNLAPGAFQMLSFNSKNDSVTMRDNVFGCSTWHVELYPSLAENVFDFNFKENSAELNIAGNTGHCGSEDLEWLFSPKSSLVLHWLRCGLMNTFECIEKETLPKHPSCDVKVKETEGEQTLRGKRSHPTILRYDNFDGMETTEPSQTENTQSYIENGSFGAHKRVVANGETKNLTSRTNSSIRKKNNLDNLRSDGTLKESNRYSLDDPELNQHVEIETETTKHSETSNEKPNRFERRIESVNDVGNRSSNNKLYHVTSGYSSAFEIPHENINRVDNTSGDSSPNTKHTVEAPDINHTNVSESNPQYTDEEPKEEIADSETYLYITSNQ